MTRRSLRRALFLGAGLLVLAGCGTWPKTWSARPCCIDAKPVVRRQPIAWHLFDVTVISQIKQALNFARVSRRWAGAPVRALNLQEGRVADSAFFTDRDPEALSAEQVRSGPTQPDDLAQPPFTVTKVKGEGKTPGFFVTDARGVKYLFKLDPVNSPELLSGAEVVTSKLLYALGYHVPSYEIVFVRPGDLSFRADDERLRAMVEERVRDGAARVCATKILDGEVLGPAKFKKFRDCAEVRALKLAYAWVNNVDSKDHNSLLVWDGRRTVGYLIDFGTSLGADAGLAGPKTPCEGWLHAVDLKEISLEVVTFGLHRTVCDVPGRPISPAVGFFSARMDPDGWEPYAPNLAFEEMNEDDAKWISRRMARLSAEQLEAAVSAGRYSDPADAAYLVDVLAKRRDAILREYLEDDYEAQERLERRQRQQETSSP